MFWRLLRFVRRFRAFTVASTVTSNVVCNVTRDTARNVTHAAHAVTSSVNRTTNTVSRIANSLFNLRRQVGGSPPPAGSSCLLFRDFRQLMFIYLSLRAFRYGLIRSQHLQPAYSQHPQPAHSQYLQSAYRLAPLTPASATPLWPRSAAPGPRRALPRRSMRLAARWRRFWLAGRVACACW